MDESNKYFVQIVDTDTGKMVACAVWEYTKSMSHEDWEQKRRERPEYPEARQEVLQVMYQGVAEKRINLMGSSRYWGRSTVRYATQPKFNRFIELLSLQTLPAYSRQGLGSQLVAWGTKKSDETGVPAFIESTEQGAGLYKKHGFQEVATVPVDLEQWAHWGGKGTYTNTFFSREPHTSGEM